MAIKRPTVPYAQAREQLRQTNQDAQSAEQPNASPVDDDENAAERPAENAGPSNTTTDPFPAPLTNQAETGSPVQTPGPTKQARATPGSASRMTISVSVPIPQKGVSPFFDALVEDYSEQEALRYILNEALPAYEALLLGGKFKKLPKDYPATTTIVSTRRTFSGEAFEAARKAFDRFGVLSQFKISKMIAQAALASYFKNENAN
ncbi:piccolo isoform 3 [Roseibium sp. TrichSKD4]|uniref:VirC2 family conjugal transfer protein n=1 Tax=Roseibium sp. TrichSKD4 TaxID=744980 RepID=UPI0001E57220|nr:VirC2 family conjugal transfer protein [Roseibium sp. TrichSKD4]EFO28782.1 piccolo isoform 3 [Roseibium sp. TrichSKD4]